MTQPVEDENEIDRVLGSWRQGDVSLDAGLEFVHMAASQTVLAAGGTPGETGADPILEEVRGVVVLTQTCDVVRSCRERPFVEVAPVVELPAGDMEHVRRLRKPAFAFVPCIADRRLVADLDRVMTVQKAVVAGWKRVAGWTTDDQIRDFARALTRKRARFAFPDDFVVAAQALMSRLADKHGKQTSEGAHLRALREIRVRAAPSWNHDEVDLTLWFIKEAEPDGVSPAWDNQAEEWLTLFAETGRFRVGAIVCWLDDITARDYVESDVLDLDRLTTSPTRSREASGPLGRDPA